jgi:hypothetical protein
MAGLLGEYAKGLLGFVSDPQSWKDMGRNAVGLLGAPLPSKQEEMAMALRRRMQGSVMRDYPSAETDLANSYREKMTNLAMGLNPVLMMAGPKAKTANLAALEQAQKLEQSGAPREAIWNQTGWFKGPEGKWKFEIDDSGAGLNLNQGRYFSTSDAMPIKDNSAGQYAETSIKSILNHPELHKAYPLNTDVTMKSYGNPGGGSYRNIDDKGFISLDSAIAKQPFATARDGPFPLSQADANKLNAETFALGTHRVTNPEATKSTLLHELQHAIQQQEGFARGGSLEAMSTPRDQAMARVNFLNSELSRLAKEMDVAPPAAKKALQSEYESAMAEKMRVWSESTKNPFDQYKRLAGEAEARAVQSRMNMTPTQRQATPPWQSYDVPWDQLIVR